MELRQPRGQHLTCGDVMVPDPACCLPSDTVDLAAQLMEAEQVGSLPVVEDLRGWRLVGIVTQSDLLTKVVAAGRDPKNTLVEGVMRHEPIACRTEEDLDHARLAMETHQLRHLPAVDDDRRVIGLVAYADIAPRLDGSGRPSTAGEVAQR